MSPGVVRIVVPVSPIKSKNVRGTTQTGVATNVSQMSVIQAGDASESRPALAVSSHIPERLGQGVGAFSAFFVF